MLVSVYLAVIQRNTGVWVNVNAIGNHGSFTSAWNNFVAEMGGAYRDLPNNYADQAITTTRDDHAIASDKFCNPSSKMRIVYV